MLVRELGPDPSGASEVVLIAAPVLLREPEEQKVSHNSKKIRGRADKYIKWLHQFLLKPTIEVRPKVTWFFLPSEPQINFTDERLNESIRDDQLIASVLDYSRNSEERPREVVFNNLPAGDLGDPKIRNEWLRIIEHSPAYQNKKTP